MMIFLPILLFSLGTLTNANYPPLAADLGLHHKINMKADSRLLLNPFSIFGNDICEYKGTSGTCYGEVECLALAGHYGNFCPGLQGLCCLFYRTCGQRTSQEVAYFRNVQYPLDDRVPDTCSFQIIKRSNDFCGLRVTMERAELPDKNSDGLCDEVYYQVIGINNNNIPKKCGTMTSKEYTYDMRDVEEIHLQIGSSQSSSVSWNFKVTQVKCSQWESENYEDDHDEGSSGGSGGDGGTGAGTGGDGTGGDGTGSFIGGGPVFPPTFPPSIVGPPAPPNTSRPTTQKPTTQSPFTTSPPFGGANFAKCGVRGPGHGHGTRGRSAARRMKPEGPLGPGMFEAMARRRKTPTQRPAFIHEHIKTKNDQPSPILRPAQVQGSIGTNGFVTSLEWGVPTLNDTLFAHYVRNGEIPPFPQRVTYGSLAGIREFPWNIAMTVNGKFHCGASLISNTHVLTAAHCVVSYKYNPNAITLSLGDWDLSTTNDGKNVKAKVSRISVHPSYNKATLQNDLAVLTLTQRVEYTERIRPICLPNSDLSVEGEQAIVSGWGRNEASRLQSQLQHLQATVVSNVLCDQRWNKNGAARGFIVQSMMCMDAQNGDSCNGDSGGPSIYEYPHGSGTYVQVGIVSFGSGSCTDPKLPGVYTRVSYYRNWIRQQMN